MRFSQTALLGLAVAPLALSAPVLQKRALSDNDTMVVKLALYLEHLEYSLYSGGYEAFTEAQYEADGFPAGFRDNVGVIAQHEAIHASTLAGVLEANGVAAFNSCTYQFPYSSPKTFVSLANMITSVGIGAYIGGGTLLVDNPDLLEAASEILTVEARHDAYLRTGIGASPFPNAFDTPLTALFAYTLAQMFVVSCPADAVLPIIPVPALTLVGPMPPLDLQPPTPAGTVVEFSWDPSKFFVPVDPNAPLYIAMINQDLPPIFAEVTMTSSSSGSVPVPVGASGVAFAVLTTFSGGLNEMQLSSFGTLAIAEVVLS